jgi:methionine-rich copper-binding protein CopC
LLAALIFLALGASSTAQADDVSVFHFALSKSMPEADAVVASPSEVKLWFTQAPQEGTTSIRVLGGDAEPIHTADVVQDAEDGSIFSVALHGTLAPGQYTVAWRALGEDGHVVRGDFSFSVTAR